jgi:cysteate synthase
MKIIGFLKLVIQRIIKKDSFHWSPFFYLYSLQTGTRLIFMDFKATEYTLQSLVTGELFEDTGWLLDAPNQSKPGLIRAIYKHKQLNPKDASYGIYRFADWLPVNRMLNGSSAPITYKSSGLATQLGLKNLYITFSGYWPEKGVEMTTCSFKETEAYSVCARMDPAQPKVLVVASAGNTARAFAKVCSDNNIPLLLCVPEDNLDALWFEKPLSNCVKLIATRKGSDYFDAIHLSNLACECEGFVAEGGAKNVARRDGMGTTMLSATTYIGEIPDYYFQAIGSGTGAIAAWEANLRLIDDGRFGNKIMKLMVSQNHPFIPIMNAWNANSREMLAFDHDTARKEVEIIDAKVLSNRKPPYPPIGGLFDALTHTKGEVLSVTNEKAQQAAKLFLEHEGNDIHPAAAVAVASLIQAINKNKVEPEAIVMLNITGGGEEKFKSGKTLHYLKPSEVFDINPSIEELQIALNKIFN